MSKWNELPESVREAIALHVETLSTMEEARAFYETLGVLAGEQVEILAELIARPFPPERG